MSGLDREKAREVLTARLLGDPKWRAWIEGALDELEGCVTEDPRIARIRVELDEVDRAQQSIGSPLVFTAWIRSILGADS